LKELRKAKNLKQQDLADFLSIAKSTYSYWETGKIEINNDNLFRLSDYYGVSIDYLLGKSDIKDPLKITVPENLKNVPMAFHRGEFEDLTQDEVNALALIAKTIKAQRQGGGD
jgi:transcriptional regulator with XRE-family HTH domain